MRGTARTGEYTRPALSLLPADAVELQHFRSDRFRDRVVRSILIVQEALRTARKPYIAFSGGKDSLVVLHLVKSLRPDATIHWTDDELEYPETVAYMAALRGMAAPDEFIVTQERHATHAGWFRPWTNAPYWREPLPGSLTKDRPADEWMAHRGYDLTFTGTRLGESKARARHFAARGLLYHIKSGTGRHCSPIAEWDEDMIWAYIAGHRLPYNPAYDILREQCGLSRERQRVGPLPLTPRPILAAGWPDMLDDLEERYGPRWS